MSSPFKFLDAYERSDRDFFFGREEEIERLYCLSFEACLVLVYGQSGTGKTSLIQCGLANRFQPTDWFQLFVRRQEDINAALGREIRAQAVTPIPPEISVVEAVRSLYLDHLRPITLIFDQFEELFILGAAEEQEKFIATVADLLASDVCCKIIISLREEYLAHLNRFEKAVPTLFSKRLRVEPMSMANLRRVITGTACHFGITLENGEETAQKIIDNLNDPHAGVQLAYLQVYLDRLWRRAEAESTGGPIVFTDEAVAEAGKLDDVMEHFLEEQIDRLQKDLATKHAAAEPQLVRHLIEEFVTVEGTKQPMSRADLAARIPQAEAMLDEALAALQRARILRSKDDIYELSHDSLAGVIAERRTADRKTQLLVRKLIRDRMEEATWLNSADLARLPRNEAQLGLTEEENAFIKESYSKRRWKRFRRISALVTFILTLLVMVVLLLFATISMIETEETQIRAQRDTDELVRGATLQLSLNSSTAQARADIREHARLLLNIADSSILGESQATEFWEQLYAADVALESGREGEALSTYHRLLREQRADFEEEDEGFPQMRLERVLVRLVESTEDPAQRIALSRELLDVASRETGSDILSYESAIFLACNRLRLDQVELEECADVPGLEGEAPGPAGSNEINPSG